MKGKTEVTSVNVKLRRSNRNPSVVGEWDGGFQIIETPADSGNFQCISVPVPAPRNYHLATEADTAAQGATDKLLSRLLDGISSSGLPDGSCLGPRGVAGRALVPERVEFKPVWGILKHRGQ